MSHAVAQMTQTLRGTDNLGLLFGNGSFATYNHAIVLSGKPLEHVNFPQTLDFQSEADAMRDKPPAINENYSGDAVIETYTAFYDRQAHITTATVVARTPEGARTLAEINGADKKYRSSY